MTSPISFQNQTVVVTGAETNQGKEFVRLFAKHGANVVASRIGGVPRGNPRRKAVDDAGGKVVAVEHSLEDAAKVVQTAIDTFGRIDVIINHCQSAKKSSLEMMTEENWESAMESQTTVPFKLARAAWPFFKRQKFGRIISTISPAGLYGTTNQINTSTAQMGLVGFIETLAKEGVKYNIHVNLISISEGIQNFLPQDVLAPLTPEVTAAAPLAVALAHSASRETGSIFETANGQVAKVRWERASGAVLRADTTLTPGAVLRRWNEVVDFSKPEFPTTTAAILDMLKASRILPANPSDEEPRFDGKVVVVTGGGAGLGRAYCLQFAMLGASVVVNDFKYPGAVVDEIRKLGGQAVACTASVENGEDVVNAAIKNFGRIDILINNAGILRDKSLANTTDKDWDDIYQVHLKGTYNCSKAAYPYMIRQRYGRIINTTSTSGIYGNFGQTNYSTAKAAIIGFSRSLAVEGAQYNIRVNTIAPTAGTQLTRTVLPEEVVQALKPEYIAPFVVLLCSDKLPDTGLVFEVGGGFQTQTRWQRSRGSQFSQGNLTPENIKNNWASIVDFDNGQADHPHFASDSLPRSRSQSSGGGALERIEEAIRTPMSTVKGSWTKRDIILYNMSLGARGEQLELVYEHHPNFHAIPTFGVIPQYGAKGKNLGDILPNFNPALLLHGEQYIEIRKFPIPTTADVVHTPKLLEVIDKGNASVVYSSITTRDAQTGEDLFYSESASFIRKSGGFGGPSKGTSRGDATTLFQPPNRKPDIVLKQKTTPDQAALYRLNGDYNPIHIDPVVSQKGGFAKPILHGLCTFGITAKHIWEACGPFRSIKVRFSGIVIPGQTLVVELWKESNAIIFQTRVEETGKLAISGGGARLLGSGDARL